MRAVLAFLLLIAAPPSLADEAKTRTLAPGQSSPRATIADAAWDAGRWVGEGFGARVEEVMSPPAGGAMIGHFSMVGKDGPSFYELVQICEDSGSLVYRVKHFEPSFVGWEEKDKVVTFRLVAIEKDALYFDGLTIARTGPDEVTHWVRIKHKDGTSAEEKLVYRRAPL
jgi:hypothetical protein